jgi:hypothetical protein
MEFHKVPKPTYGSKVFQPVCDLPPEDQRRKSNEDDAQHDQSERGEMEHQGLLSGSGPRLLAAIGGFFGLAALSGMRGLYCIGTGWRSESLS